MFLLKTPLPIDDTDMMLIDRWTRNIHWLQKVYLFHGYDEEADVGDNLWMGSNNLYRRRSHGLESSGSPPSSGWYVVNVRPKDFGNGMLRVQRRWITMLEEDLDIYDSEVE
jgi:hypothetical protein